MLVDCYILPLMWWWFSRFTRMDFDSLQYPANWFNVIMASIIFFSMKMSLKVLTNFQNSLFVATVLSETVHTITHIGMNIAFYRTSTWSVTIHSVHEMWQYTILCSWEQDEILTLLYENSNDEIYDWKNDFMWLSNKTMQVHFEISYNCPRQQ